MPTTRPLLDGPFQRVVLTLPAAQLQCSGEVLPADSVAVEAVDPGNMPIPCSFEPPQTSKSQGYSVSVLFDAIVPGWYHFSANFEPSLGRAQRDLLFAHDRTATAFEELVVQ